MSASRSLTFLFGNSCLSRKLALNAFTNTQYSAVAIPMRGKVDFYDRLERVSSQTLLDLLEVPQRNRTAGTYRRLGRVMAELGWTAVRVRDLTRGGYKEQVRGYCRPAQKNAH